MGGNFDICFGKNKRIIVKINIDIIQIKVDNRHG